MVRKPLAERFEAFVMRDPNSGCWLWTGFCNPEGYGYIGVEPSIPRKAHRVSYELHKGPIPSGMLVRHKCDVPWCVNPDHLELGTDAENMRDRDVRKRTAVGKRNGKSKLTPEQAAEIKIGISTGKTDRWLSNIYGVAHGTIYAIRHGRTWAHI